jgi:hypothetical protein
MLNDPNCFTYGGRRNRLRKKQRGRIKGSDGNE